MSWINDPVNSPKHYTDSHPGMECIDLTADTTETSSAPTCSNTSPPI